MSQVYGASLCGHFTTPHNKSARRGISSDGVIPFGTPFRRRSSVPESRQLVVRPLPSCRMFQFRRKAAATPKEELCEPVNLGSFSTSVNLDASSLSGGAAAGDNSRASSRPNQRVWIAEAMSRLRSDGTRSAETHLIKLAWPAGNLKGVDIYLKDESVHPTGSLKHRLARSLFIYGIVNNWIGPHTTIIEASSGSTAVSEAYFAKMLGLRFVAVMPRNTSQFKCAAIERQGGVCHFVDSSCEMHTEAQRLANECNGYYMNQFGNAEKATDWRATNNIAQSIFEQLKHEEHSIPTWICVGAGTGGTCATLGRYLRYSGNTTTRLCVADPENSVSYDCWLSGGDRSITTSHGSRIEGIGRPRVEESFLPELVDHMLRVPDSASLASMRFISEQLGRRVGATTGTSMYAVMQLAKEMVETGQRGSVVALICDHGERYAGTYWDNEWVREQGFQLEPYSRQMEHFWATLEWIE